ncbi:MAG TPA: glycosyltransferase [Dermatophilaceae bacterium]|nr:glycosyltransferase [Dermatophilaceae bacterium]
MTDLLVATPWYPTEDNPYAGSFVRETVRALARHYPRISVVHVENRPLGDPRVPFWSDTPEGRVLWIGVPMDPTTSRHGMILAQREALARHAGELLANAAVIHCHTGAPTGAALVPLVDPQARLVVTEHASYLPRVLADPVALDLYRTLMERADAVTSVSARITRQLRDAFGDAHPVTLLPNPTPLHTLPSKDLINPAMSAWLFVGTLTAHKGVRRLVRAFAAWVDQTGDPAARLTLVGTAPLERELTALAADLGVANRVELRGPVDPARIAEVYLEHDLLVHLSQAETFGLTCVEAAACGLPVVSTESGGPQTTLAVHAALGLAAFLPVGPEEDIEPVLAAVRTLALTADPANLALSRADLERRYGSREVGDRLAAVLSGRPTPTPLPYPGMRVLSMALTTKEAQDAEFALTLFAELGGGGVYLAGRPPLGWLPAAIRVVDISGIERCALVPRVERALIRDVPAAVLRAAERGAMLLAGAGPSGAERTDRVGRMGTRAVALTSRLRKRHATLARRVHEGPYDFAWRNVGPWYVARKLAAAGTLAALDLDAIDCIALPDDFTTPIAFRALQLNPDLVVRRRWSPADVGRRYVELVLRPAHPGDT